MIGNQLGSENRHPALFSLMAEIIFVEQSNKTLKDSFWKKLCLKFQPNSDWKDAILYDVTTRSKKFQQSGISQLLFKI